MEWSDYLTAIFLQPAAFKLSGSVIELPLISSATHHSNITDHMSYIWILKSFKACVYFLSLGFF